MLDDRGAGGKAKLMFMSKKFKLLIKIVELRNVGL